MAKVEMQVEITNPKDEYKSGDALEGTITLVNTEKDKKGAPKPTKVKEVSVSFAERVSVSEDDMGAWNVFLDGTHDTSRGRSSGRTMELTGEP